MFGGYGINTVSKYAHQVKSLEIWEIREECLESLERMAPKAVIKILDSYKEVKHFDETYDVIVVDDNKKTVMVHNHYEHFDLFPEIFNMMNSPCILILNICPELKQCSLNHYERRRQFYKSFDGENIPINWMINVYTELALENGFKINWAFTYPRNNGVHYLAMSLTKN